MILSGMGFLWFLMAAVLPYGVLQLTLRFLPWPALSLALAALSLIPAPPATAALFDVTWYLAHERRIEFGYFWRGFKEYFGWSWKVTGVLIVALAVLLADVYFFFRAQGALSVVLSIVMLWALLFWLAIQVYLYPLLIALEEKRVGLMFKNAAQLVMAFPLFCLLMLLVALVLTALSVLLVGVPFATFWMPMIALLFSRAFASSWNEAIRIRQGHQAADEQTEPN